MKNIETNIVRKTFFVLTLGERYNVYSPDIAVTLGEKRILATTHNPDYQIFDHYLSLLYFFDVDETVIPELFISYEIMDGKPILFDLISLMNHVRAIVDSIDLSLLDLSLAQEYIKAKVQFHLDQIARTDIGQYDGILSARTYEPKFVEYSKAVWNYLLTFNSNPANFVNGVTHDVVQNALDGIPVYIP